MSLMFGDNVLPTCNYSRAVDDDDDDSGEASGFQKSLQFSWNKDVSVNAKSCSSLVLAVGPAASGFVQVYILSSQSHEKLGEFRSVDELKDDSLEESHGLKRKSEWTGTIYRLTNSPGVIVSQCMCELEPELSFDWTKQMTSMFNLTTAHVTVLTTCGWGDYKTSQPSSDRPLNLVRALKSTTSSEKLFCALLEQPNVISGLPAQVLTHCQINKIPCMLYVCYCNTALIDGDTLRAYYKVCTSTNSLGKIIKESEKTKDEIMAFVKQHRKDLTLFM